MRRAPTQLNCRILIAESQGFSPLALGIVSGLGSVKLADADPARWRKLLADADVLWARVRSRVDAEVLDAAPRLRVVVCSAISDDLIDTAEAARRGIRVISLAGAGPFLQGVRATAEHTVGLMLALLRSIPASVRHVRNGGWDRDRFKGHELYGKTVGIVGYGRLGRMVARYLGAFEACVLAADPHVLSSGVDPGVRLVPFQQLLPTCDIVSVHVSHSPGSPPLFGRDQFAAMRSGSWFINTSCGEAVDEAALVEALRCGKLAGAAVDVVGRVQGPGPGRSPLLTYARRHNHLIVTPHVGGCTAESMEKIEIYLAHQLADALASTARTMAAASPPGDG